MSRAIVVGGGLAGLTTVIKACEAGLEVDLFSFVPVKRSHSVCAQGGINASVNSKGEGDSPEIHFRETCYGGDFLANQPPVLGMCRAAPAIVFLLDRMGVPFNRTPEGLLDFRRLGGTQYNRTAFAGATTGQQLLYALDEQVRRFEAQGLVRKLEMWEMLCIVRDGGGRCVGIVAQDLKSMEIRAFGADAVCLATGGCGVIFGRSTNSTICTGTAAAAVYRQGALYANGEFIQVHPTAIPGPDKLRVMSESVRSEGGRVWVPKDPADTRAPRQIPPAERLYFLEERYPAYGNLVPRDIASREIFRTCVHEKRGIGGKNEVYLDVTHLGKDTLKKKLGGVLEIYERFVGDDPSETPMRVFPAVHYTMGGLWVDYEKAADGGVVAVSPRNQATSIPGLWAVGEVDYQYHGANRLGANSLLSCIYGGLLAGPAMAAWARGLPSSAAGAPTGVHEAEEKRERKEYEDILAMSGGESPYGLHRELGELMLLHVTVERNDRDLETVDGRIREMMERWARIGVPDSSRHVNQAAPFTRQLRLMLLLAQVIVRGAIRRNESRGAHFKPDHPARDDRGFGHTTLASHAADGPRLSAEPIDLSGYPPVERKYEAVDATLRRA